jgi:hypothetical protein
MKSHAIDPDVCSYDPPTMREFGLPTADPIVGNALPRLEAF